MKYSILFSFLLLFLLSCSDDNDSSKNVPYSPVVSQVSGQVVDQGGNPLVDVEIEMEDQLVISNVLGLFLFDAMTINAEGTFIKAIKPGYFMAAKNLIPNDSGKAVLTITMIAKPLSGTFSAQAGGTIVANGNVSVTFSPNSIVDQNGTSYVGNVETSLYWMDPSSPNLGNEMPGDLRAFNANDEAVQLATYGMMAVELSSPSGQSLNLADGQTASLRMPLSPNQASNAPTQIPMWFFNEETGYWEEEGMASLVGNAYVGDVAHFSFWNCDAPFPIVDFEACFLAPNGSPLVGALVQLSFSGTTPVRSGVTDALGKVYGKIPKDEVLDLTVLEGSCLSPIYQSAIGPFANSIVLPPITINSPSINIVNLQANFLDCNSLAVSNGIVFTSVSATPMYLDNNGSINSSFYGCDNNLTLWAYDLNSNKTSSTLTFSTTQNVNNINVLDEPVCGAIDEFINMDYNGVGYFLPFPNHSSMGGSESIYANVNNMSFNLDWIGSNVGNYVSSSFYTNLSPQIYLYLQNGNNLNINISQFGPPGGYIEGTFSGNVWNEFGNTQGNVTGSFRVIN